MNMEAMGRGWSGRAATLGVLVIALGLPAMSAANCFKVMDATLYVDKPDMPALGIQPIKLVEPPRWWHGVPNDEKSLKEATTKATGPLMGLPTPLLIDLELELSGKSPDIAANRQRYIDVIHWMREAGLTVPLSYYSSLPVRDYWRAVKGPGSPEYRAWQAENDALDDCTAAASLYPACTALGIDLVFERGYGRHFLLEVNAFGDFFMKRGLPDSAQLASPLDYVAALFQPWVALNRAVLREGRLPLWNSLAGCGAPHLGSSGPCRPAYLHHRSRSRCIDRSRRGGWSPAFEGHGQ